MAILSRGRKKRGQPGSNSLARSPEPTWKGSLLNNEAAKEKKGDYIATNNCPMLSGVPNLFAAGTTPFTTVVGGQHYLASNSLLRGVGTTNIATNLLAELKLLTTYPPLYRTNTINTDTVYDITAPRDRGTNPDLGYHYTPLDYVVSGLTINTNATLVLTNGAAIGIDYGARYWGIIFDTGKLISQGSALNLNRIIRAHCSQENSSGNPGIRAMFWDKGSDGYSHGNSEIRLRFTELSTLAQDGYTVYVGKYWSGFEVLHSQLYNTSFYIVASQGGQVYGITNTLVDSSDFTFQDYGSSSVLYLFNNLIRSNYFQLQDGDTNYIVCDNLFENTSLNEFGHAVSNSNNGYYQTTSNKVWFGSNYTLLNGSGNQSLTNLTYLSGLLGPYYQPTNSALINTGSRTADNAGLYHFTTTMDQIKETNSIIDIGVHFVALDINGQPFDTELDGIPDYIEDANGNGLLDPVLLETDWQTYTTISNTVPGLQVFTPLK